MIERTEPTCLVIAHITAYSHHPAGVELDHVSSPSMDR